MARKIKLYEDFTNFKPIDVEKFNPYGEGVPDLIDVLHAQGATKIKRKDGKYNLVGVVLPMDMIFYHRGPKNLKILKPINPQTLEKGREPVLNLGSKGQAMAWPGKLYKVILKKGTEIFPGMDGYNHIVVYKSISIK